ncbi:WD40 repeat-like protein [Glarea lozoyensis ATCC 20868]|uniref:Mitochondrial division protein 1 n=1 Tax=Glarea lozoyensis (strain ATCC 20868 / MF5171) TaxID=1116229 RepID=S3CED9_GLAL2|nr:WD40 repeat-like protein [Glarea lozoyensis ATCC 20868]EPE24832.1 WD40 repeat-like protein [Glarea lozoyensis ATCC 20868]
MKPLINFQVHHETSIQRFRLTQEKIIVAAQTAIAHNLQCQHCQDNEVCTQHLREFEIGGLWNADFNPSSKLMLTANHDRKLCLWDVETGTYVREFLRHVDDEIKTVLFLDEITFAAGFSDGALMIWSSTADQPTHVLVGHTETIHQLACHDQFLFSGSRDKTVRIWNIATGECVRVLEGHTDYISAITVSPDFSLLRVGSGNRELRIWDWRTGELVAVCQTDALVSSQYGDIDGKLVTCGLDGKIRTWTQKGDLLETFAAHEAPVRALAMAGRFVVTGARDGTLKVWDWDKKDMLFEFGDPELRLLSGFGTAHGMLYTDSGKSGLGPHHVQIWDLGEIERVATGLLESRSN